MAASVFQHVSVYPLDNDQTIVAWRLHPRFCAPGPYTFTVEASRHDSRDPDDWQFITNVTDTDWARVPNTYLEIPDSHRYRWSTVETWFYRVRLTTPDGRQETSYAEPAWGSLPRHERLKAREIFRRELLRLRKTGAGSPGWLLRRRWWGEIHEPAVDVNTLEVTQPRNTVSYGTPYVGGYFPAHDYWMEFNQGPSRSFNRTKSGTRSNRERQTRGLAWPPPGSFDLWVDRATGRRYYVNASEPAASMRNVPIVMSLLVTEAPPTDIAYEVPVPMEQLNET